MMHNLPLGRTLAAFLSLAMMLSCKFSEVAEEEEQRTEGGDLPTPTQASNTSSPPPASPTPSPKPSATTRSTQSPGSEFSSASIYAVPHLQDDALLVTVQVPDAGLSDRAFEGNVAASRLPCEILAEYPQRLYCSRPGPFENCVPQQATFERYGPESTAPLFHTEFTVSPQATPTTAPTDAPEPTLIIIPGPDFDPFP